MERTIITGPKGGKYWLDDKGKKHYVKKSEVTSKKKKEVESPRRYTFRMYTEYDPEDGSWVWTEATSEEEARRNIMSENWGVTKLDLHKVE